MTRETLNDRRPSFTVRFDHGGARWRASGGFFPDGRLAEVFLDAAKSSDSDILARDAAVLASFALQYGAPVERLRAALSRDEAGRPLGPLCAALDALLGAGA